MPLTNSYQQQQKKLPASETDIRQNKKEKSLSFPQPQLLMILK